MDITWADIQRAENGDPPAPLSFTADELYEAYGPDGPDEQDVEALNLAMDRDMQNRERYWEHRALAAEEALEQLQGGE